MPLIKPGVVTIDDLVAELKPVELGVVVGIEDDEMPEGTCAIYRTEGLVYVGPLATRPRAQVGDVILMHPTDFKAAQEYVRRRRH